MTTDPAGNPMHTANLHTLCGADAPISATSYISTSVTTGHRRVGSERAYRALIVLRGRRLVRRVQATTAPTALWGAVISIKEVPRHADIDGR